MAGTRRQSVFFAPPLSLFGPGVHERTAAQVKAVGGTRPFLCTDKGMVQAGISDHLTGILRKGLGTDVVVYDGVIPNPTDATAQEAVELFRREGCDVLVSLGGGSAHDCAKAVGILAAHGGTVDDYVGLDRVPGPIPPLVAVNTTAGTGSDVTRIAVLTDPEKRAKRPIIDWKITPTAAVNDPVLMEGMPPALTAATGLDALTHAVEAYLSTSASPVSDALALEAVALIGRWLPKAYADGKNGAAREKMAYAQHLAGLAFNSAGLGYAHAMAHPLGGRYDLPHGVCNAVLLPHVLDFVLLAAWERLARLARVLGEAVEGLTERRAAERAVEAVRRLVRELGVPERLSSLGVRDQDVPELAREAQKDPSRWTSPRRASEAEVEALYRRAL